MVQLDSEQRVFAVKTYFETHSSDEVIRLFRERFPSKNDHMEERRKVQ